MRPLAEGDWVFIPEDTEASWPRSLPWSNKTYQVLEVTEYTVRLALSPGVDWWFYSKDCIRGTNTPIQLPSVSEEEVWVK